MSELELLLAKVETRLEKKLRKAEEAYVLEKSTKKTHNCKFSGRRLSDEAVACLLKCQGTDEVEAAQCWNEKATGCTLFQLKRTPEQLIRVFRSLPEDEIKLRWPSIGELLWLRAQLRESLSRQSEPANLKVI